MKPSKDRGILGKPRLNFADNEQLRRYYEGKYREGGYEDGWVKRGVNISELYHARRRQVALGFLRSAPDEIVLDAGCGKGTLAGTVAPTCREIHAIDIATNALDEEHRSISNLHFQQMNVETLNFADEFFDKVVCIETLEHVLNPQRALSEFYRVLKKGGRLVLTYPTINRTVVKRLYLGRRLEVSEHINEWSYGMLRANLTAAGFDLEDAEGISFDFGALLALKGVSRFLAKGITNLSLSVRCFPANSLFVCLSVRK